MQFFPEDVNIVCFYIKKKTGLKLGEKIHTRDPEHVPDLVPPEQQGIVRFSTFISESVGWDQLYFCKDPRADPELHGV